MSLYNYIKISRIKLTINFFDHEVVAVQFYIYYYKYVHQPHHFYKDLISIEITIKQKMFAYKIILVKCLLAKKIYEP